MHRILVVDDEQLTADTLAIIFEQKGFETRVAYSVDEALACIPAFSPSLILCDITMPGRDGLELMVEVGLQNLSCGVLVLTGYHANLNPVTEQFLKMSQRTHVLTKPCTPEQVLREASRMLACA